MNAILIYAAQNPSGSSAKIVAELQKLLKMPFTPYNVVEKKDASVLKDHDILLFLTATYGDGELQPDIENFIASIDFDLAKKKYSVIEIGNYYGYDDYHFGARKIVEGNLAQKNAVELFRGLSMDTLPLLDWTDLNKWAEYVNTKETL